VFIPKYRKKDLFGKTGKISTYLDPVFHELAAQRNCKILEGHMVQDHVHFLIRIPPKYSVEEAGILLPNPRNFFKECISIT
jgi:putative transposase